MFTVIALDHSPALVVVVTDDQERAFRIAARYACEQGSRVDVLRSVLPEPITPDIGRKAHTAALEADEMARRALDARAQENAASVAALLAPVIEELPPLPSDDGGKANAGKRR